jgi:hypothetical protein
MKKAFSYFLFGLLILAGLYVSSLYNYLLFHNLAEIFSIVIAFGIFAIAWNSRLFLDNNYLLFIGIAYLFVGGLDLLHTFSYKGMAIFGESGSNLPTQLWIAARYMESLSLLIAPLFFHRRLKTNLVFLGYSAVAALILLSTFFWKVFPVCFVEGVGLTLFKKMSEYTISLILLASIGLLLNNRKEFDRKVLQLVIWSIIVTIGSELAFTFYVDVYGLSNLIGHYLKILSFFLMYKAIIETGLTKPYDLLFRNVKQSEERYRIVADNTYDWEFWLNPEGKFNYVSPSCKRITGREPDEFIRDDGLRRKIIFPEDLPIFDQHCQEEQREETPNEIHYRIIHTDGTIRWIGHVCKRVFDEEGRLLGIRSSNRDITVRKRAEEVLEVRTMDLQHLNETLEQRVHERTVELEKANEALRYLSSRLLSAHEEERKRIAGEIHDVLGSCLGAIKFKVEDVIQQVGEKDPTTLTESLKIIIPVIQESIEECRRLQMDLRPSMLDDLGLLPALSWFCRRFQTIYSGIRIEQENQMEEAEIPDALKIIIYRVTQEGLNNIAKHSKADRVHLSLQKRDGRMELVLQDNGRGFDPERVVPENRRQGLGLTSMKERVELSGGSFAIESSEGKGAIIRASWPI